MCVTILKVHCVHDNEIAALNVDQYCYFVMYNEQKSKVDKQISVVGMNVKDTVL